MNGISVMIDTNIAIALLNGDESLAEMLDGKDVRIINGLNCFFVNF